MRPDNILRYIIVHENMEHTKSNEWMRYMKKTFNYRESKT